MLYLSEDAELIRSMLDKAVGVPGDSELLFLLYAVLMRAKGVDTTAADVHDAWVAWMQLSDPAHPALVPYDVLDPEIKEQDAPFVQAIRRAARIQGG